MTINIDRIDFISEYCDRWCERCSFTTRCSLYAVQAATAMCDGDLEAALELAVGAPPPEDAAEGARRQAFEKELLNYQPTESDIDEVVREEDAREERLEESPLTTSAEKACLLARAWLESNGNVALRSDSPLADAIAVSRWDSYFVSVKLRRALRGQDEYHRGEAQHDDPVQNDWNGSAKVALISIRRSTTAWAAIAAATADPDAAAVAEQLRRLETETEHTFPDAWKFVRPGFDEEAG